MDNQQETTVQHMELCSMFCSSLDGRRVWERMDAYTYMADPLCCEPETITTLLIGYTPLCNEKLFKNEDPPKIQAHTHTQI